MIETREYRSSRGRMLRFLLLSLAFVAAGLLLIARTPDNGPLWLAVGFFGLGALVFAILLVRPQRLLLDGAGFTVSGGLMLKPSTTRWRDIDRFFVHHLPKGGKMIGFNYRPDAQPRSAMIHISRGLGADGAIPKGWAEPPEVMVEGLNAYRARALGED